MPLNTRLGTNIPDWIQSDVKRYLPKALTGGGLIDGIETVSPLERPVNFMPPSAMPTNQHHRQSIAHSHGVRQSLNLPDISMTSPWGAHNPQMLQIQQQQQLQLQRDSTAMQQQQLMFGHGGYPWSGAQTQAGYSASGIGFPPGPLAPGTPLGGVYSPADQYEAPLTPQPYGDVVAETNSKHRIRKTRRVRKKPRRADDRGTTTTTTSSGSSYDGAASGSKRKRSHSRHHRASRRKNERHRNRSNSSSSSSSDCSDSENSGDNTSYDGTTTTSSASRRSKQAADHKNIYRSYNGPNFTPADLEGSSSDWGSVPPYAMKWGRRGGTGTATKPVSFDFFPDWRTLNPSHKKLGQTGGGTKGRRTGCC